MVSSAVNHGRLADGPVRGRGAGLNPANRFERLSLEVLDEHLDHIAVERREMPDGQQVETHVYRDDARSIINRVDSPDLPFHWTINPYRGCEHGCVYCYARPTHETLGLSCGLDFETRIFAKTEAPDLLRQELADSKWTGEPIVMSGVTDAYQPVESQLKLTRQCLEVMVEAQQPVSIVTKSRLILRDLDLLRELARHNAVHAAVSVTSLDNQLASKLEPRAASPRDRLWTIQRLASAGVPVMVMAAPIIPGINDREIPGILKAASAAGASAASFILLRLPYQIKDLFDEWLARHFPDRRKNVLHLLRRAHDGKLYDATWSRRARGSGPYAEQIRTTFKVFAARHGLDKPVPHLSSAAFRHPAVDNQLPLFDCA